VDKEKSELYFLAAVKKILTGPNRTRPENHRKIYAAGIDLMGVVGHFRPLFG